MDLWAAQDPTCLLEPYPGTNCVVQVIQLSQQPPCEQNFFDIQHGDLLPLERSMPSSAAPVSTANGETTAQDVEKGPRAAIDGFSTAGASNFEHRPEHPPKREPASWSLRMPMCRCTYNRWTCSSDTYTRPSPQRACSGAGHRADRSQAGT